MANLVCFEYFSIWIFPCQIKVLVTSFIIKTFAHYWYNQCSVMQKTCRPTWHCWSTARKISNYGYHENKTVECGDDTWKQHCGCTLLHRNTFLHISCQICSVSWCPPDGSVTPTLGLQPNPLSLFCSQFLIFCCPHHPSLPHPIYNVYERKEKERKKCIPRSK